MGNFRISCKNINHNVTASIYFASAVKSADVRHFCTDELYWDSRAYTAASNYTPVHQAALPEGRTQSWELRALVLEIMSLIEKPVVSISRNIFFTTLSLSLSLYF
jgi:hypothetical protein